MKFGLLLPNRGKPYGDVHLLLDLALLAEESGWDGWFIWDHIGGGGDSPCIDPWICLASIASRTRTMRLGTLITPLARRRPWKVAREITTLDHLSHGRAVLSVGLGDRVNKDFGAFGEVTHPVTRAEMLDEALDIVTELHPASPLTTMGITITCRMPSSALRRCRVRACRSGRQAAGRTNVPSAAQPVGMGLCPSVPG
jgi:alkanesulfonate monooxygenase SsuD/methylene tetrahydromethanopterin reductase-like flavin-dependent oxidoreductase (luciferase family)